MNSKDRADLIKRISDIEGLTDKERSALLGLLRENKTYGLVWEDKPEDIEERLRDELPILTEVPERAIISEDKDAPNHILIEGDNLEALATLVYTHEGKIDVIYIDPPYNTGARDWKYNNDYVESEDSFRHSKWLSMMKKRLKLARRLLTEGGIIICAIDHYELFYLGTIMDEVFREENRLGIVSVVHKPEGRNQEKFFGTSNEFALFYAKDKGTANFNQIAIDEETANLFTETDEKGKYRLKNFIRTADGKYATRKAKPNFYYPIYVSTDLQNITLEKQEDYYEIFPIIKSGVERTWKTLPKTFLEYLYNGTIIATKSDNRVEIFEKLYENQVIRTHWIKKEYHAYHFGTKIIDKILGEKKFNFPKSLYLIQDILKLVSRKNSTILDFFAGSGTTLHATMQQNAEDGGNRKCILVTNNENNICEEVTYERNKRVINGYTTPKGEFVEGLKSNNLRYYRTGFVGRSRSMQNMRKLVNLSTDMLCIKEDLYTEQPMFGEQKTHKSIFRYFDNGSKQMLIIYREEAIDELVEVIYEMDITTPIKVYVFSPSEDPWEGSFEEVSDKVELCALPQAIYNTYRRILPKKRDAVIMPEDDVLAQDDGEETTHDGMLNFTEEEEV